MVIDRSSSIGESNALTAVKNTAIGFVDLMDLSIDQVGLVTFNDQATLDQPLSQDRNAVVEHINAIVSQGGTDIAAGTRTGVAELTSNRHNPNALPVLILLTDGISTGKDDAARDAVRIAKEAGIVIITIGLGDVNDALLQELATTPQDYYKAPAVDTLGDIYERIAHNLTCR